MRFCIFNNKNDNEELHCKQRKVLHYFDICTLYISKYRIYITMHI